MKTSLWLLPALLAGCTVVVRPPAQNEPRREPPPQERPREEPPPVTAVMFGVPPGHLPDPGECRLWYPGTVPGRQPRPRSRPCEGLAAIAPAGTWIIYRPTYDRRLVYVRVVDERRPGLVVRVRIFDLETDRLVREEAPQEERPPVQRPPVQPPPVQPPPVQPPPEQPPPEQPPPPAPLSPLFRAAPLAVPTTELPDQGECRLWIPRAPLIQQPLPRSRSCQGIAAIAPPSTWIVYRPSDDSRYVYLGVEDERRAGVLIRILVYDLTTTHLVRDQLPQSGWPPVPPLRMPPPTVERPPIQPPVQPPPTQRRPTSRATLSIPPGQLPAAGECRLWIPGDPPGRQPRPKSRPCDGMVAAAPAGSWVLYVPANDPKVVYVRMIDERRAGVVVRVQVFDIQSKQLVREENP